MPMGVLVLLALGAAACGPGDPCAHATPMCIEAGPPEALRAFVVQCIGGHAPNDEADHRVSNCMEAGYALHCTRRVRVVGVAYFTESGPHYDQDHVCPLIRRDD